MDNKKAFVITEDVIEECLAECLSDGTSKLQFSSVYTDSKDYYGNKIV